MGNLQARIPPPLHTHTHLMCCADKAMQDVFGAEYVSLHVRVSNKGAIHLYTQTLGYRCDTWGGGGVGEG
jgi:N-alpha-acetyltransferase 10/11